MIWRGKRKSTYDKYDPEKRISWVKLSVAAGVVFLLAAAAVIFFLIYRSYNNLSEGIEYKRMTGWATLPVVTMNFDSDSVNQLFGYTEEMDIRSVRDTVYILEDTYSIIITAETYGLEIKKVSFKLFDLPGENLIQSDAALSFTYSEEAEVAVAELLIDNVISENTEYNLIIDLTDKNGRDIYYYTRIIRTSTTTVHGQIDLVKKFHNAIYSKSEKDKELISSYLETDLRYEDNISFGHVYLKSSYNQVVWDDMKVVEVVSPVINIVDINGEIGCFRLDYIVAYELDSDTPEYLSISEYFRVRYSDGTGYILAYDRTAETIFMPSSDTVATKSADLGILPVERDVEIMSSPNGNYACFAASGSLWMMDTEKNTIRAVFTFMTDVNDIFDPREVNNQHNIRPIQVSDDGSVEFMVYGYMTRGLHEGKCGLGIYMYNAETDLVEEEVFMLSTLPYQVMENTFGSLCYLSKDGNLYIMIDEAVYVINISSSETTLIEAGLNDTNSLVSTSGKYLAWQKDGLSDSAAEIIVLNMETEEYFTVEANEGCSIKILGFLGTDLVYGSGTAGNYYTSSVGKESLLMDKIFIANGSGTQTYETASKDIYYVGSEDQYNRVVINCVDASNDYAETSNLTIYTSKADELEPASAYTDYVDIRETVTYVEFVEKASAYANLIIDASTPVLMSDSNLSSLNDLLSVSGKYYVYANGRIEGITDDAAEAIQAAYDGGGVVVCEGNYFYRRGLRSSTSQISEEAIAKALTSYNEGSLTDVTGITLTEAMYFLGIRTPLAWSYEDVFYIVCGYTASDSLILYNTETGETSYLSYSLADAVFADKGQCFVIK